MSMLPHFPIINGRYDEDGLWESHKKCFAYCGERCDCGPPLGQHYSPSHDQRVKTQSATVDPWDSWKPSRDVEFSSPSLA